MVSSSKVKKDCDNRDADVMGTITDDTSDLDPNSEGQGDTLERGITKLPKGDSKSSENGVTEVNRKKCQLKKVSVSPRVELMMNNELFKKYLKKNGHIIEKMYKTQGKTVIGGVKKALSNLDLTKIDFDEEFSQNTEFRSRSSLSDYDAEEIKSISPRSLKSQNPAKIRDVKSRPRSLSLTGRDDPCIRGIEEVLQRHKKNMTDKNGAIENNRREIRKDTGQRTKFHVPSFAEFKRMRREKLVKGQEFVKSVINNKENLPLSFPTNFHRQDSNEELDKEAGQNRRSSGRQSCPDISVHSQCSKDISYAQNVKRALKSVSDKMECSRKRTSLSFSSPRTTSDKEQREKEKTDEIKDDISNNGTYCNVNDNLMNVHGISSSDSATVVKGRDDMNANDLKLDLSSSNDSSKIDSSSATQRKTFHRSKSFSDFSPQCIKGSSLPSKSKSSRHRRRQHSLSLTEYGENSQAPEKTPDPLELSTDGTSVYVTMNISSAMAPPFSSHSCSDESDSDKSEKESIKPKTYSGRSGETANKLISRDTDLNQKPQNESHVRMLPGEISKRGTNNSILLTRDHIIEKPVSKGRIESPAIVRLSEMKKSCEESAKIAGITLPSNEQIKTEVSKPARTVLRASRKRKLPARPPTKKSESKSSSTSSNSETVANPPESPKEETLSSQKLVLGKSLSEDNSSKHFLPDSLSPGPFSFSNSPSPNGSSVFVFPSPTGSQNSSENDLSVQSGSDEKKDTNAVLESKGLVMRSTSDVSNNTADALRKRRHRKQRPYKSDPFTGSGKLPIFRQTASGRMRSIIHGKEEFLEDFPDDVSIQEVDEDNEFQNDKRLDNDFNRGVKHRLSNMSDVSTDSGVIGQESIPDAPPSPSSSVLSQGSLFNSLHSTGQDSAVEVSEGHNQTDVEDKGYVDIDVSSDKALYERRETILEIKNTEISYGRDLKILREEFYKPMKNNGLLSSEQLEAIFLNLDELIHVNTQFTDRLEAAVDLAVERGDENLASVVLGDLFLKSTKLILTFEHYCVNQSQATILLEQLEREKELLRIFLKVCQDEHAILRRMHLKSFLMVPVQRIMKYPLLLERLFKATPPDHQDREALLNAKNKIESILEHINSRTKSAAQVKLSKRKSNDRKSITVTEKIEVTRIAMDVLGWHKQDVCDILTGQVLVAQTQSDQSWAVKRLRNVKFSQVHAILLTLGQGELQRNDEADLLFPQKSEVIQAAVVLIKEKNGKFQKLREPFLLNRCVVNVDNEEGEMFELMELNKESFLFKCEDPHWYKLWLQNIRQQTLNLGTWRKRRNALPNIMIKHLIT